MQRQMTCPSCRTNFATDIHQIEDRPDTTQQTVFIHDVFPSWHGDLKELAEVWLQQQLFDLYEDGVVNLKDYAVLADLWLQEVMFVPR